MILFFIATPARADITTGLVGWWKFNEGTGTSATADSSGQGNNGVLTGHAPSWVQGKLVNALSFNGTSQYVQISGATDSLKDVTKTSFTFVAWVKPLSFPPSCIDTSTVYYGLVIRPGYHTGLIYNCTGRFAGFVWMTNLTTRSLSSPAYTFGSWHHVVQVVDDAAKNLYLYVDGTPVTGSPVSYSGTLYDYATSSYNVGAADPANMSWSWLANAVIDDVRIYNRALSAADVSQLYALGVARIGGGQISNARIGN
jgi:hypothetical protein